MAEPELEIVEPRTSSGTFPAVGSRRRHVRIPVELSVILVSASGEHAGVCTDMGIGGMCISTDATLEYGEEIVVLVDPVGCRSMGLAATSLCLPATVRWRDAAGLGVQFALLGAGETRGLVQLIRHWSGRY